MNNLNAFAAAAEYLSFQEAARQLFVTPSAVSHQIRNLETVLGYKLFNRLDKGIALTPAGERLFADIREPLKQLHAASNKALRGVEDNVLSMSVAPVFATGWLLPRLKDFYQQHPGINLSVIATTDLVDFATDTFDASIRMGKGEWVKTRSIHLFDGEIVAVCHPDLLRKNKRLFLPLQLLEARLIKNSSLPELWIDWFDSAGISLPDNKTAQLEVQGTAQVIEALQAADSFGLADRSFIENDIAAGRLMIASDHVLNNSEGYYLVYPDISADLASFKAFKQWIVQQLTDKK